MKRFIMLVGVGVMVPSLASAEDMHGMLARCAPSIHPETMAAVVSAESRGNVLAVADAGPMHLPWSQRKHLVRSHFPSSVPEAVNLVKGLLEKGHTVSLGLSQVNDRNLPRMGLTVEQMFEPCSNVRAGGQILAAFYAQAVRKYGPGERALRAALSGYNSGDFVRGERDGYVNLVIKQAGRPLQLRYGSQKVANTESVPALSSFGGWPDAKPAQEQPPQPPEKAGAPRWRPVRHGKDFTLQVSTFQPGERADLMVQNEASFRGENAGVSK